MQKARKEIKLLKTKDHVKEKVINVKSESYSVRDVKRDGNYLFRCFSYYLYETEELHLDVRRNIVKFTIENWDEEQELVKSPIKNNHVSTHVSTHVRTHVNSHVRFSTIFSREYSRE